MKADIAIYGSHNAAIALAIDGEIEMVVEVERFLNRKNVGLFYYFAANTREYALQEIANYIRRKYGINKYNTRVSCYVDGYEHLFPAEIGMSAGHHLEHAYGSLYQSPHDRALIFSFDGGGNDGYFNVYLGDKTIGTMELVKRIENDLGFAYMSFGDKLAPIRHEPFWYGNLVYSGKIMGLCAYGKVQNEWLPHFINYYLASPEGPTWQDFLDEVGSATGINFRGDRITDQLANDIAATSQRAFEEAFLHYAKPIMDQYPGLPIHMAGGCALNIILNTRLKEEFGKEVFVSPNPNDCGIAVGMLCRLLKPMKPVDVTYAGIPVLDENMLFSYCEEYNAVPYDMDRVVEELATGAILGVVRGRSEHGPRALGNRSILCNPAIPGMKDTLNAKVKNREWYRPFAPVVRLEDVSDYFEWQGESRWMSFCPRVKEEWKERLAAITHVDGTARVQTVTREQNPWLYDLITKFKQITGHGVLLNTSFNVAGKPILSSYADAIKVFRETQLDRLLLENYYFAK